MKNNTTNNTTNRDNQAKKQITKNEGSASRKSDGAPHRQLDQVSRSSDRSQLHHDAVHHDSKQKVTRQDEHEKTGRFASTHAESDTSRSNQNAPLSRGHRDDLKQHGSSLASDRSTHTAGRQAGRESENDEYGSQASHGQRDTQNKMSGHSSQERSGHISGQRAELLERESEREEYDSEQLIDYYDKNSSSAQRPSERSGSHRELQSEETNQNED